MRIVVRMPNWVGDAVLALPVLDAIKARYAEAGIWIAAKEWAGDLVSRDSGIKAVIPVPEIKDLRTLRKAAARLKPYRFDLGLLLTNSLSSALVFYLAGIPERWGYSRDGRGFFLTRKVSAGNGDRGLHQRDSYAGLLSGLGFTTPPGGIDLHLTKDEKAAAAKTLAAAGRDATRPLIILNPGASYGPAKRWPAERFAEAGSLFESRLGADILVTGTAEESEAARTIAAALERKPMDFTGRTTLRELAALIDAASLFVTNDTGPMHIAVALKVPVVAVFGPTDPRITGPLHGPARVLKKDVPCWPCLYRKCPFDHRCMTLIGAEEVLAAGRSLL
jgi:heptosyltransferase-2